MSDIRKIYKSGNSTVITLDSEMLDALGAEVGDHVWVDIEGETVKLTKLER